MKKQITILLISVVALLASYSFLSCGFDSRLGLNFACPASLTVLFNQNTTVDQPISSAISPGTYFVYSINQAVSGAGSAWENKLLAYNQENKKTKLITTKDHFFVFQIKGNKIFASDTLSSVYGSGFVVGLDGKETPSNVDDLLNPVIESQDGNRRVLVSPWNSDASNLGCQKDGLKIQINQEGGAVIDKNFSWKDYGLNHLCPEEYYFSHNGKYFYIVGDSVGGGSVDTVMKYSVDEDKMTKIEIAENSWLNFWSLDVDNGWMAGISNGYNLGVDHRVDHRIFKINLMSGEMTDLLNPHSLLF